MFARSIIAAAVVVFALAADASAQTHRSRPDALFEPWRAPAARSRSDGIGTPLQRRSDRYLAPSQAAMHAHSFTAAMASTAVSFLTHNHVWLVIHLATRQV